MFYSMTHSHSRFIYGYMTSDVWVKDYGESQRGNLMPKQHGLLFSIGGGVGGETVYMPIST